MNIKLSGIVAAGMLAMMALAPMGLAHLDNNVNVSGSVNTTTVDKPSGNVVGVVSPRIALIANPIEDLDPSQDIPLGGIFCDMEVASGADDGTNELWVDGYNTGASNVIVDEGQWDDGGFGVACHTTNMDGKNYDTWGCDYGEATADDPLNMAPLQDVWVIVGCDVGFRAGGDQVDASPFPGIAIFEDCLVNNAVLGNFGDAMGTATTALGCEGAFEDYLTQWNADGGVVLWVDCDTGLINPTQCPSAPGSTFTCHDSDLASRNGQGREYLDGGFGSSNKAQYPSAAVEGCDLSSGIADVLVLGSVVVDTTSVTASGVSVSSYTVVS